MNREIHSSHNMSKWESKIRAPAGTPRFYRARHCKRCGGGEIKHPAGHFVDEWLYDPCVGDEVKNEDN